MALRNFINVLKKDGERRRGRGLSRGELKKAGVSLGEALRLGLAVDARRRTIHDENVKLAKQQLESSRYAGKHTSKKRKETPAEE